MIGNQPTVPNTPLTSSLLDQSTRLHVEAINYSVTVTTRHPLYLKLFLNPAIAKQQRTPSTPWCQQVKCYSTYKYDNELNCCRWPDAKNYFMAEIFTCDSCDDSLCFAFALLYNGRFLSWGDTTKSR
ncbi:hypothetical protein QR680_013713 [Steinernema hermaphroditum]|uniref:Uncharacterized protein n=1 Tax=Steinernema hermaphroditum TaxID=289476 RepID=A0AA39I6F0_9BILA|nr:hypothetical protein QR680_013713 [Steinernema hermaphroditum]